MKITRVRDVIASTVALILVVLLAAFGALALGIRVPILSSITGLFGY